MKTICIIGTITAAAMVIVAAGAGSIASIPFACTLTACIQGYKRYR